MIGKIEQLNNRTKGKLWCFFLAVLPGLFSAGCSERVKQPVILPDSTIVYPSKKPDGISAGITFSLHYSQKSGRQWAVSDVIPLKENENVYAVIGLENRFNYLQRDLMFHVDWIGPDGRSVYLKRTDLPEGDSTSSLVSSISIEPEKRPSGKYLLRAYLFRELIAEKYVELRDESEIEKVTGDIIFYKSIDQETSEMKGVDTVFEIKKKGILRVQVNLTNLDVYEDEELPFRMEWSGPDGESFYSKKIEINRSDTVSTFNGSISITPDKREPGEYFLRVYLFDEVIGEKRFVLKPSE